MVKQLDWYGLYSDSWKGEIVDEAFSHPAKYSRALIRKIYQHMLDRGWIKPGDKVIDPFGGVALGGRDAAANGLLFTGNELELAFVILAHKNIIRWYEKDWCTCDKSSQVYVQSLRDFVRENDLPESGKEIQETKVGGILQHTLPEQIRQREGAPRRASQKDEGKDTLEQGEGTFSGNKEKNIREGKAENRQEKPKLEGRKAYQKGRVRRDTGKQTPETGTRAYHGTASWQENESGRSGAPQKRGQAGQSINKSGSYVNIGAHETAPSKRGSKQTANKELYDLRLSVPGEAQRETLQRIVQAREAAAISAKVRREEEGPFCKKCFKLIAMPPLLLQGDSRQLSSILAGQVDGGLSSPPYADAINSGEGPGAYSPNEHDSHVNGQSYRNGGKYGASNGQLGGMSAGDWDAAVSSSPFEGVLAGQEEFDKKRAIDPNSSRFGRKSFNGTSTTYGESNRQLGNSTGTTFWTAARQIVEQTYMVLKPGAYVAFVCGDFVRQGKRVYFGRQWMELCEAVGFKPVEWAIAWKTEYKGNQLDIFGNDHEKRIDRVSFFRRLANDRNPDNAILNEDVIFMRKPM